MSRVLRFQFLVHSSIGFFFSRAPRSALIDKPMLRRIGLADIRFRATVIDDLVITIAGLLISIFHPKTSLVYYVR